MTKEEMDREKLKALLRELLPELMAEGILKTIKGGASAHTILQTMHFILQLRHQK